MSELVHGSTGEAWYKRALEAHAEIIRLQTELAEAKNIGGEILQELFAKTAALSAAQATIAKMTGALEPFVKEANRLDPSNPDETIGDTCEIWQCGGFDFTRSKITYGDLRKARAALASPAEKAQPERYRHVKRGSFYTIVGESALQTDTPLTDMADLIVYRAEKDGTLWVRSKKEFYDGRFVVAEKEQQS